MADPDLDRFIIRLEPHTSLRANSPLVELNERLEHPYIRPVAIFSTESGQPVGYRIGIFDESSPRLYRFLGETIVPELALWDQVAALMIEVSGLERAML